MNKIWTVGLTALFGAAMVMAIVAPARPDEGAMGASACPWYLSLGGPSHESSYVGAMVLDRRGEGLGRVIDVTVDGRGLVNFLIVSSCLPGMPDQLVAIPFSAFDTPGKVEIVTLDLTRDNFEAAPSFHKDSWPYQQSGGNWAETAYLYFDRIS
jgi:hypothetical protein